MTPADKCRVRQVSDVDAMVTVWLDRCLVLMQTDKCRIGQVSGVDED